MSFGQKGSVRDLWHYIYKEVANQPDIEWDEFYNDPKTQKYMQQLFHALGPDKAEERVYEMFADIKKTHGYEEDECEEEEEYRTGEDLTRKVNKAVRDKKEVDCMVESICRRAQFNSRYHSMNIADRLSHKFN